MKTIDHTYKTVTKTICPFCNYGCEFGVVFNDFGVAGIEYIEEGNNQGRLCPRGSAAAMYLNHRLRLSTPVKKNQQYDWKKMTRELKRVVEKPEQVAVTFDRNITIDEYKAIVSFCAAAGIEQIASSYLEPETLLKRCASEQFTLEEIKNADVVCAIGDIFNQTPMSSKTFIDWRLADKKHRFIVIDGMHTHTSGFATDFLKVLPGTEALALLSLAHEDNEGINVQEHTGVDKDRIQQISELMKKAEQCVIAVCLPFARTYDPALFIEGVKRLQDYTGARVVPFVEFEGFEGNQLFGTIFERVKKGKIKHIINFGELFPFYYPQIAAGMKKATMYATSTLKWNDHVMIPGALNLEKQGTINTLFGARELPGTIKPPSGVQDVKKILEHMGNVDAAVEKQLSEPVLKIDIESHVQQLIERKPLKKKKSLKMFGEKVAFNFLGLFDRGAVKVNVLDARALRIRQNDMVTLKSKQGKTDIRAAVSSDIDSGNVVVPVEDPHIRALFAYNALDNLISFVPTEVEIWRKG